MGKKYKKKVQWRQLSLKELQPTSGDKDGEECEEEEEGESGSLSPTQDSGCPYPRPYPRHPHHPHHPHQFPPPHHFPRRGAHHHSGGGYYYRNNFDKRFDRRGGFENIRNLENRGPYKPSFYDRHYQYDNKYGGRPPYGGERGGYKFGYSERGRRPFRPYGRPGFFHKGFPGHQFPDGRRNTDVEEYFDQEDEEEEWDDVTVSEDQQHQQNGCDGDEKPSQPVHTVMINNEEYTKIQTPRQEVIFKKSSLDRRQDSLDQSSVTGSTTSASGSSSTTGAADGTPGGTGDQMAGDQESVSGSLEDNTPSVAGDDSPEQGGVQDHVLEDPSEIFVNESGGPPLAGVVMQQAYPGGPMYTIPVHWTPFIDPSFIPGETALTPLDPAFTHVIDPKSLPIDPVYILPVQHDAAGCPVQVQVKVDSNGVPIQIEPSAFTVSLSSIPQHHLKEEQTTTAATEETATSSDSQEEQEAKPSEEETVKEAAKEEREEEDDDDDDEEEEEDEDEEEEEEEEKEEKERRDTKVLVVEGETAETQDTLNEAGEIVGDKEDKLGDKAETKDTEEEKEREEKDEVPPASETTQERHQQSTSADLSAQSSSCDVVEDVVIAEKASVEEKSEGENERNVTCEEVSSQEVEEQEPRVPTDKTREVELRKEEDEEDEEDEEEEEEEDMLTKESEEGSDSNDSQYASMSESSSTPTTPSGELTDPHETPTATHTTPVASSAPAKHPQATETDSHDSQQDTPAVRSAGGESNGSEATEDSQTDRQTAEEGADEGSDEGRETTPKISQGYVMVPILTPYYDPSVLYGYPVVVPTQQQQVVVPSQQHQQPSPPPQQHHHNYNKKKKKKYQRRRQADAPPAGTYLDPQLYTGEPFVATPGGYVVPLETAASVCHIHGIQYVTPAFHQRLPDEGFVSLQHSPYLPDVAAEPPTTEAHTPEGTNSQSDTARTVFSDLQDTERQQIQEILQEHNKVSKTDSTESSDSGVSESEEAAAAEASSDELETRQDTTSPTQITPESEDSPDNATDTTTLTQQCQEDSLTTPEVKDTQHSSIQHSTVTAELCSASAQADVELCIPKESQACQTEESISEDQTPWEEVVPLQVSETLHKEVTCSENKTGGALESITVDTESRDHQTEAQPASPSSVAQGKVDIATEGCNGNTVLTEANEKDDRCKPEILQSECIASEESSNDTSVRDSEIPIVLAQETEETLISNTSVIAVAVDNQNSVSSPEIKSESCDELTESPSNKCISSSSTIDESVLCKSEGISLEEENFEAIEDFSSEVNDNERIVLSQESYERRDNNISIGRLKELKVTEAVTRWIREVTPEKAFTLSEEVQSRLLADQESFEEMDTEDEYIEDEMATEAKPNSVLEPKNVRGNPFVALSSESPVMRMDSCSKRVALMNKFRGTTPDTIDDYDGSSTISNLSVGNLHSEASSCLASVNQSFDEDVDKYAGNPEMYDPSAYAKYYQLGIEVDEITPTATPPLVGKGFRGATPSGLITSETISECGSEDIDSVPLKYEMTQQYTENSPLSLATEILKAEKVINNMVHITGDRESSAVAEQTYGNPDLYLKHYDAISRNEVSDSGVQSEDSSDETEGRSIVSSSGVGSSLASTPAVSPAHHLTGRPPLQPHPLKNLSVGEGPVPCKTVCCAVM